MHKFLSTFSLGCETRLLPNTNELLTRRNERTLKNTQQRTQLSLPKARNIDSNKSDELCHDCSVIWRCYTILRRTHAVDKISYR